MENRIIVYHPTEGRFILSDAFFLYEYLYYQKTPIRISAKQVSNDLGWSISKFRKYRNILHDRGYIDVELTDNDYGGNGANEIIIRKKPITIGYQKQKEGVLKKIEGGVKINTGVKGYCNPPQTIEFIRVSSLGTIDTKGGVKKNTPLYNSYYNNIGQKQLKALSSLDVDLSDAQLELLIDFLEYRNQIKKPLTAKGISYHIRDIKKEKVEVVKAMMERCIKNGWQGWYFPDKKDSPVQADNTMKNNAEKILKGLR